MYKILSKLVDEYWRHSKPKQCHFWAWLKRPIFGVHDSQGSAETLVRTGGITNYRLIAYSFSNISAKNYQNRLMCIEVIVYNVSVVFWDTVYVLAMFGCCSLYLKYSVVKSDSIFSYMCEFVSLLLHLSMTLKSFFFCFCSFYNIAVPKYASVCGLVVYNYCA